MQLFAIPLKAYVISGAEPVAVIGARDAETTITFLAINSIGRVIEVDVSGLTFDRSGQQPHRFDLVPAYRLGVNQLSFTEVG